MTATIHDVARRAGVSVTTVSRALTQPELLRPATRERVLDAARKLAYHPNRAARSLITGKTGNIGIVVPDLSNPFYPGVVRGAQLRAHQAGYAVFLADSNEDAAYAGPRLLAVGFAMIAPLPFSRGKPVMSRREGPKSA